MSAEHRTACGHPADTNNVTIRLVRLKPIADTGLPVVGFAQVLSLRTKASFAQIRLVRHPGDRVRRQHARDIAEALGQAAAAHQQQELSIRHALRTLAIPNGSSIVNHRSPNSLLIMSMPLISFLTFPLAPQNH